MKVIKNNIKIVIAFIIGLIVSGGVVYAISFSSRDVTFDKTGITGATQDTVQGALEELYGKAANASSGPTIKHGMTSDSYHPDNCITPTLNVGDYISLTPTLAEYRLTSEESPTGTSVYLQPQELDLWRVIKKNECNVEVVSEYVSTKNVYFIGTTGYKYFVGALNTIAGAYENSAYTVGSRMFGYDGQTEIIDDSSSFNGSTDTAPGTTSTASPTSGTGEEFGNGVLGDTLYLKDYNLVSSLYTQDNNETNYCSSGLCAYKKGTTTKTTYWFASRFFDYRSATYFDYDGRVVRSSGTLFNGNLRRYYDDWYVNTYSYAVRPILTLKSGITTNGGTGAKDNPYTLS